MEFSDLEALIWVNRHGSLQRAASAVGVSRTTLRRRLQRLETTLGKPVHSVSSDGITLTAAGQPLVEKGPLLLHAPEQMIAEAVGARSPGNTFRLLVQLGSPPRLVASAIASLTAMLPGVQLVIDLDPRPLDRLDEGFDAVVHWGARPAAGGGYTRQLFQVQLRAHASPDYLARRGTPTTPADLADHDLLHWSEMPEAWPLAGGLHVPVTPAHTCSDLYQLGCLAGAGVGIALIPSEGLLVDPTITALVPVLAEHVRGAAALRIYMPTPSHPDSAAGALIEVLEQLGDEVISIQSAL